MCVFVKIIKKLKFEDWNKVIVTSSKSFGLNDHQNTTMDIIWGKYKCELQHNSN